MNSDLWHPLTFPFVLHTASTSSPAGSSLGITVIVIIVILMVVLLAIIIFTILALMAKRVRSKRARESSVRRPHRSSQSRSRNTSQEGGGPPRQQHQRRPTPDSSHPGRGAPMFTSEGDQYTDLEFTERAVDYPRDPHPPVIMNPAGAPPPYSTLPRPFEESLQMADGTTPTSRSRLASINNDLENHWHVENFVGISPLWKLLFTWTQTSSCMYATLDVLISLFCL